MNSQANVVSVSGGKDSLATALLAIEREAENLSLVFADTGHEHAITYEYIDYLQDALGLPIERVRADFSAKILARREKLIRLYLQLDDGGRGIRQLRDYTSGVLTRMIDLLQPTGVPFLDLCLWKGRFPSTRRRFCSEELKHKPLDAYLTGLLDSFDEVFSWQGVRRDESASRARLVEEEDHPTAQGIVWYRPILDWDAAACFAIAARHGIKPNPLYKQGMSRVGCMPCIHVNKNELLEIAARFPAEIERVAEYERLVSAASKRGASTFLDARVVQRSRGLPRITAENLHTVSPQSHGIAQAVQWAQTSRDGRMYDLLKAIDLSAPASCKSLYGLCE